MAQVPQQLHLIWLGSMPPNSSQRPYRRRLVEWTAHNPSWAVHLWTDHVGREAQQMAVWCIENGVVHHSIADTEEVLWGDEHSTVVEQVHKGFYANASDILRLRILYQLGGVYVDFDVEPISLPTVDLPLGLGLVLREGSGQLESIAPHAIASVAGHSVLQIALWQALTNFQLLSASEEPDFRYSSISTERYGGVLVLTGDILRPALRSVFGLFGEGAWGWSAWLEALRLSIPLHHFEDLSWIGEDANELGEHAFFPSELGFAIAKTWSSRPLTSVLHLTAMYSEPWLIQIAAQQVLPFENHFGYSPRGLSLRAQRPPEVVRMIPDI